MADAFPLCAAALIERIVDVEREHLAGLGRFAAGQREVLVKELERVGQRQERTDRDGRHDHRQFDLEERLRAGRAVDGGGFQQIAGHVLQARDVDDHHIADLLPAHQDDEAPEAVPRVQRKQRLAQVGQNAVEQNLPDIAQHDAADQVRQEEDGAESVGAVHTAGEKQRDGKGQHVDQQGGHDGERRCEPERMGEGVIRPNHCVVA